MSLRTVDSEVSEHNEHTPSHDNISKNNIYN